MIFDIEVDEISLVRKPKRKVRLLCLGYPGLIDRIALCSYRRLLKREALVAKLLARASRKA